MLEPGQKEAYILIKKRIFRVKICSYSRLSPSMLSHAYSFPLNIRYFYFYILFIYVFRYCGFCCIGDANNEKSGKNPRLLFCLHQDSADACWKDSHKQVVRQKILDVFHDKTPISASKVSPGKDVYYDVQDEGLVLSIVGEIRFLRDETQKSYFRNGRHKTERMREAVISDGSRTLKLTIWGFLIDLIKDNILLQLVNVSSKYFNE